MVERSKKVSKRPAEISDSERLIAALRSGKYYQTRNCVADGAGGHCAIGVAAVLGIRLTREQVGFLQNLNNDICLTFDEIARMLEVRGLPPPPAPAEDGIDGCIRKLQALAARPLDAVI